MSSDAAQDVEYLVMVSQVLSAIAEFDLKSEQHYDCPTILAASSSTAEHSNAVTYLSCSGKSVTRAAILNA